MEFTKLDIPLFLKKESGRRQEPRWRRDVRGGGCPGLSLCFIYSSAAGVGLTGAGGGLVLGTERAPPAAGLPRARAALFPSPQMPPEPLTSCGSPLPAVWFGGRRLGALGS